MKGDYAHFSRHYEEIFPFRPVVRSFLRSYLQPAQKILDIGCGTGLYASALAREGFEVVGIDLDKEMVALAVSKCNRARFHVLDMSNVDKLKQRFHMIYAIGNVIPHLQQKKFRRFLKKIRSLLYGGGHWIFQTVNWDWILRQKRYNFPVKPLNAGISFERQYESISHWRVNFKTRLVSDGRPLASHLTWLYPISAEEYKRVHHETGFQCIGHYRDFSRNSFQPDRDGGSVFTFKKVAESSRSE